MKYKPFPFQFIIMVLITCFTIFSSIISAEELYKINFLKAQELDKEGFFEDSVTYWEKTIEANPPGNITLYSKLKLANTYSRLTQLDKALALTQSLTLTNPNDFDSWFHLANILAAKKQYPRAIEAFKKTTELKPKEGLGRVGLAIAYFGNRQPDSAILEFKGAMKLFKANKNISWYRDCRLAINQIKGFARFPASFADLWLEKNFKRVQVTYLNAVLNLEGLLK